MTMNRVDLEKILSSQETILEFLVEKKLLKTNVLCNICSRSMNIRKYKSNDGYTWRCSNSLCNGRKSIRKDSIFQNSTLEIKIILLIVFEWCCDTKAQICATNYHINIDTVLKWYEIIRTHSINYYNTVHEKEIGGEEQIIEVDESQLGRRKYHPGRKRNEVWVFGAINRNNKSEIYLEPVKNRSRGTLLNLIYGYIKQNSIIVSDSWKAYSDLNIHLPEKNFQHYVINHKMNFVDPQNPEIHTQNIENLWSRLREFLRNKGKNYRINLNQYLEEFKIRRYFDDNLFDFVINSFKIL